MNFLLILIETRDTYIVLLLTVRNCQNSKEGDSTNYMKDTKNYPPSNETLRYLANDYGRKLNGDAQKEIKVRVSTKIRRVVSQSIVHHSHSKP